MIELAADHVVVTVEKVVSTTITYRGRGRGGIDDVSEEHCGENSVVRFGRTGTAEKLVDLIPHSVTVLRPIEMVCAGKFDHPGSLTALSDEPSLSDRV